MDFDIAQSEGSGGKIRRDHSYLRKNGHDKQ